VVRVRPGVDGSGDLQTREGFVEGLVAQKALSDGEAAVVRSGLGIEKAAGFEESALGERLGRGDGSRGQQEQQFQKTNVTRF
jgi:hypothetical protein